MNRALTMLVGAGMGAVVMYFLDPNGGGRRRALVRDKAVGLSNDVSQAVTRTKADITNRAHGLVHEAKALMGASSSSEPNSVESDTSPIRPAVG